MKHFIITIDTEGDNLWNCRYGQAISTQNARFIPRFQKLCDTYGYKPVYLVNYEMAQDVFFAGFANEALCGNTCEIGIHLHSWNNPPYHELEKNSKTALPYLIEYPKPVMEEKFSVLHKLLKEKFNTDIVSHRSGRWAMNQDYYDILIDHNIKIDCSVTPHVSWESSRGLSVGSRGTDYTNSPEEPFRVRHSHAEQNIMEIPLTVRMMRHFASGKLKTFRIRSFASAVKSAVKAGPLWLRPTGNNLSGMLALIDHVQKSASGYLMFMLHSSELMPGGSPTFKTPESIEKLYADLEIIFTRISGHFAGISLKDYYKTLEGSVL